MAISIINLNKLLKLCSLQENQLIGELRGDLRSERDKVLGRKTGGGHFQHPWWDAAKRSIDAPDTLWVATAGLVAGSKQRKRLYPMLTEAFLKWLFELRRSTNMPVSVAEEEAHTHYEVPGLDLTLKVDNLLALKVGNESHRHIYPYFSERPELSEKWARVGLWLMSQAFGSPIKTELEILDVLRSRSFGISTLLLRGDESTMLEKRYNEIRAIYDSLRPEYEARAA